MKIHRHNTFTETMENKANKTDWRLEVLRYSICAVLLWFGILKFLGPSGVSDSLAIRTLEKLTFGYLKGVSCLYFVAVLECVIGIGLLVKRWLKPFLILLVLHLIGTAAPLLLFPSETWKAFLMPTFEGQYIIKNVLIVAGAIVLSAIPSDKDLKTGNPGT
ncbi:hypothetical protein [Flavobacterium sp.]|uniref:hypothetical protein n=1 Tax=Flavobacterium sp. TaxID=239 RepID=UPI00121189C7|nr:hypothetical protein [Flavobacterium sp.]RZJ73056.1 MAG: hypothetical protein EOO49_05335 [Flavobacterium sp.]